MHKTVYTNRDKYIDGENEIVFIQLKPLLFNSCFGLAHDISSILAKRSINEGVASVMSYVTIQNGIMSRMSTDYT